MDLLSKWNHTNPVFACVLHIYHFFSDFSHHFNRNPRDLQFHTADEIFPHAYSVWAKLVTDISSMWLHLNSPIYAIVAWLHPECVHINLTAIGLAVVSLQNWLAMDATKHGMLLVCTDYCICIVSYVLWNTDLGGIHTKSVFVLTAWDAV